MTRDSTDGPPVVGIVVAAVHKGLDVVIFDVPRFEFVVADGTIPVLEQHQFDALLLGQVFAVFHATPKPLARLTQCISRIREGCAHVDRQFG